MFLRSVATTKMPMRAAKSHRSAFVMLSGNHVRRGPRKEISFVKLKSFTKNPWISGMRRLIPTPSKTADASDRTSGKKRYDGCIPTLRKRATIRPNTANSWRTTAHGTIPHRYPVRFESMKILVLNDDYAGLSGTEFDGEPHGRGGAAVIAAGLAESYAAAGHNVHVLTTHQSVSTGVVKEHIRSGTVTSLPIRYPKDLRHYLSLWNPTASRLISEFLRNGGRFDAVHVHNVHNFLTYHSLTLARQFSKRVLITFHDVMSVSYGRIATKRYLDHLDPRLTIKDHLSQAGRTYNPLRNIIIRKILRNIDCRVTVSEALRAVLERNGVPVDAVIHNGIAPEQSGHSAETARALTQRWNLAGKKELFLGGRLRKDKGVWESF